MNTILITDTSDLPKAAELLRAGGMAAVPTETVYGLCADGLNADAVARLYQAKGRPEVKPLALMIPSAEAMGEYARDIPPAARALAERFWPGPLTIILPARTDLIPSVVLAGGDTVGLRCPDHPLTLRLLELAGVPLAGPSANPSGLAPARTAREALAYFDGIIDAVLDGGECREGEASTVLDMSRKPYRILRQGALDREKLDEALAETVRVIGLTGGSGGGKTTVLRYLESKGALRLDCDDIYHELLESDQNMLSELRKRFPEAFASGSFDRKALGRIVFADAEALEELNAITHRYVIAEVRRRIREFAWHGGETAVVDAIALFESGLADMCCLTVGVTADEETRVRRIMDREGVSEEYARQRVRAQKDESWFAQRCDRMLYNNGTREQLKDQIRELFEKEFF